MQTEEPYLILTGPTAVGKTALSLELAEKMGAEIISADSRQVYKRLNIGTAKPTPEELARAPHHFIDELPLDEPFSAGEFARQAVARIREIVGRGRVPLVVGASGLYLKALQFGLADIPEVSCEMRQDIEARLEGEGARALFEELRSVDPEAAATMDPTKTQRLVRALEVYHGTGKPLTFYHENHPEPPFSFSTVVLHRERKELYERINKRVEYMLDKGLLQEVKELLEDGYSQQLNPLRTIGYREPIRHLRGEISYDEMARLIKRNTRRYAKRQLTWFRRFEEFEWMEMPVEAERLRLLYANTGV